MRRTAIASLAALLLPSCLQPEPAPPLAMIGDELGVTRAALTREQRRVRAGVIRDVAAAAGIETGWLLAGIADAETNMSHCWSELTWACMGPTSPDCGGGPVVAGAGDGPCHLRQGGLGMFQFDAGTYDDTLRREGERILYLRGNIEAAIDFVTRMVIRSAYVPGVDTREQAIEWMNGVRIGNSRWDPWLRTVTHYYNGCAPTYSCWSSRYEHYRSRTVNTYEEMGASFWDVRPDWAAQFVMQTFPLARDPFVLLAGGTFRGYIEMRNVGTQPWRPGEVFLGTTEPRDGASPIAGPDWLSPNRAATIDREVAPGATGRFEFTVRAPDTPGVYPQYFNLVREGVAWFSDSGGPPDAQLQIRVESTPPPPCPEGIDSTWSCDGDDRVRCERGMVFRETCELGCVARAGMDAVCGVPPIDEDGDGFTSDDCAPRDPRIHPGAADICGDGIDQDCDGMDAIDCELAGRDADAGIAMTRGAGGISGGCSAGAGRGRGALLGALVLGLGLALRRAGGVARRRGR
jgi:hypothetical protein